MTRVIRPLVSLLTPARAKELGLTKSGHARRDEEFHIQAGFVEWLDREGIPRYPELALGYAIPNNRSSRGDAIKKWREGARSGAPDWVFPLPRGKYHSIALEFKRPGGPTQPTQRAWLQGVGAAGVYIAKPTSAQDAIQYVSEYFTLPAQYDVTEVRKYAQELLDARLALRAQRVKQRAKRRA